MARVQVAPTALPIAGVLDLDGAATAPTVDGDAVDPSAFLYVNNGSAGALTVTYQTPLSVDGLAVAEHTVTVAAGDRALVPAVPKGTFARPGGSTDAGKVYVDFSTQASITRLWLQP